MSRIFDFIKELVYPPKCIECGALTNHDMCLCPSCLDKWEEERRRRCNKCGRIHRECSCPISDSTSRLFGVFHLAEYEKGTVTSDLVYKIKDGRHTPVNCFLARQLYEMLKDRADFNEAVITYVPRSRDAIKRYGSDQAMLLARELARLSEKELLCLITRKGGGAQKDMNFAERRRNVRRSYFINEENAHLIEGKRIFVVDDIITTGSTVSYIADLLLDTGARSVSAVSVARRT